MFIRYNQGIQMWEYDVSGGSGVGPWEVLPIDYAQIVNGPIIIPPEPIPPNIAFTDVHNIWTALQTMRLVNPAWYFENTASAANSKVFRLITTGTYFLIQSLDDTLGVVQGEFQVDRAGNTRTNGFIRSDIAFYERLRTTPLGHWQDVPFNAVNFRVQTGDGTWTIGASAVVANRFALVGLTMVWTLYISWFSGSNINSGSNTALGVKIPFGLLAPGNVILSTPYAIDGSRIECDASPASDYVIFNRRDGAAFTNGGAIGLIGTFTFEVYGAGVNVDV